MKKLYTTLKPFCKKDWPWPKGSWICSQSGCVDEGYSVFRGNYIFSSAMDCMPPSKFGGLTIWDMIVNYPRELYQLLAEDKIFIYPQIVNELQGNSNSPFVEFDLEDKLMEASATGVTTEEICKRIYSLRRSIESHLTFERIDEISSELWSIGEYTSTFSGMTIPEIIEEDPKYLPYLISRRHLFISRIYLQGLLGESDSRAIKNGLNLCIQRTDEVAEIMKTEREEREYRRILEEERAAYQYERGEIESSYRDAFDGNYEAEWNID